MKFILVSAFLLASVAQASTPKNCVVTKAAGWFASFTQPQRGDRAVLDLDAQRLDSINVGASTIATPSTFTKIQSQGSVLFAGKDKNYTLQLSAGGDQLNTVKIQSLMTDRSGLINLGILELSCTSR